MSIPLPDNVNQGHIGDCYFLAALVSTAKTQPDVIKKAISYDSQSGHFHVKLHRIERNILESIFDPWGEGIPNLGDLKEVDIEVTQADLADNMRRGGAMNGYGVSDNNASGRKDASIWTGVMETAFAKMNDGNWANGLDEGYDTIDGGSEVDGMRIVTGRNVGMVPIDDMLRAFSSQEAPSQLTKALAQGKPVTMSTGRVYKIQDLWSDDSNPDRDGDGLIDAHVYAVTGFHHENGKLMIDLQNPWGGPPDSVEIDLLRKKNSIGRFVIGNAG